MKCCNYNKLGHFSRDCRARRQQYTNGRNIGSGRSSQNTTKGQPNSSENGNNEVKCFIARKLNNVILDQKEIINELHIAEVMTIGSAASELSGNNLGYSIVIEKTNEIRLELTDGSALSTSALGQVMINTGEIKITPGNVYYVSSISLKIFFSSFIDKSGVTTIVEKNNGKLLNRKNSHMVAGTIERSKSDALYNIGMMLPDHNRNRTGRSKMDMTLSYGFQAGWNDDVFQYSPCNK